MFVAGSKIKTRIEESTPVKSSSLFNNNNSNQVPQPHHPQQPQQQQNSQPPIVMPDESDVGATSNGNLVSVAAPDQPSVDSQASENIFFLRITRFSRVFKNA